jgi:Ferredoxin
MNQDIHVFYFSPCGTTKKVAYSVAKGTALTPIYHDLTLPNFEAPILQPGSLAVFAGPIYFGVVPEVALNRMQQVDGTGCYAVAAVVYGNRDYNDGLLQLGDILTGAGFTVLAGGAFVAQHSISAEIATGRPNVQDLRQAENLGGQFIEKCKTPTPIELPGKRPYKILAFGGQKAPVTALSCTQCGLCSSKCPTSAINPKNNLEVDALLCIGCMRCVYICPQHAKSFKGFSTNVTRVVLPKLTKTKKNNELFI